MRILVAGGGIGGLTAALCLNRAGFLVDVHERAKAFGELGAGIQLGPNAMRVYRELGLADTILQNAVVPERLELRAGDTGATVFSIDAGQKMQRRYKVPYAHIHRADLVEILSRAVKDRCGDGVHLASSIGEVRSTATGAIADFENGKGVRVAAIVGADGINSRVRQALQGSEAAAFSGYVAWRALVARSDALDALVPRAATVWAGPDRHAVTYRLRGGDLINFVGVVRQPDWTVEGWSEPGDVAELRAAFAGFAEPVAALTDSVERAFKWAIRERAPSRRWGEGQVTLLGDAAHPMPPFMAQGAGMAVEDAWVLAVHLSRHRNALAGGLRAYELERRKRTAKVQDAAWRNLAVFHTESGGQGQRLRGQLRLANRFAPGLIHSGTHWIYNWKPAPLTPG
jgi:salicylate hydroxylase